MTIATTSVNPPRVVRAPHGSDITCKGWAQEAALRSLMDNLDPDAAENPAELILQGPEGARLTFWLTHEGGKSGGGYRVDAGEPGPDTIEGLRALMGLLR